MPDIKSISVLWTDEYLEDFEASEVRYGSDLLWMRLSNNKNRHIPLRDVRWFTEILKRNYECESDCKSTADIKIIEISVRWFDGYLKEFSARDVSFGSDMLCIKLLDDKTCYVPLRSVRWFSMTPESHGKDHSSPPSTSSAGGTTSSYTRVNG